MNKQLVQVLIWIGGAIAVSVSVAVWMINAHSAIPAHDGAVTIELFEQNVKSQEMIRRQYMQNEKEWRDEMRREINEIKALLNMRNTP